MLPISTEATLATGMSYAQSSDLRDFNIPTSRLQKKEEKERGREDDGQLYDSDLNPPSSVRHDITIFPDVLLSCLCGRRLVIDVAGRVEGAHPCCQPISPQRCCSQPRYMYILYPPARPRYISFPSTIFLFSLYLTYIFPFSFVCMTCRSCSCHSSSINVHSPHPPPQIELPSRGNVHISILWSR